MTSNHPPIIAASVAAARRRRALPSPQDISTTSLLTILGVVAAHVPGARSRGLLFFETSKIAISEPVVVGPSRSTLRPRRTVRTPPRLPFRISHGDQPPGVAAGAEMTETASSDFWGRGGSAGRP